MPSRASSTPAILAPSLPDALPILSDQGDRRGQGAAAVARDGLPVPPRGIFAADGCDLASHVRDLSQPGFPLRRERLGHTVPCRADRSEGHTSERQSPCNLVCRLVPRPPPRSSRLPYPTLFRSYPIKATEEGKALLQWPEMVYQFHREGFSLPTDATLLATSETYPNQAFRYGENAWGIQFHAELTDRKGTRLNASHLVISYAVSCLVHPRDPRAFPTRRSSDLIRSRRPKRARRCCSGPRWSTSSTARDFRCRRMRPC